MAEKLPSAPEGPGLVGMLTAYGDLIKAIPGAATALAHLVTGAGDAGVAWIDILKAKGEQRAQAVRDITAARSKFIQSVGNASAARAAGDADLLDRAIEHFCAGLIRSQETREEIAGLAIENLRDNPHSDASTQRGPSEDWMNIFSTFASRATSQTMREHWAQILSGEIRKPGAFSLATLQVMSVLDPSLAQTIIRVWPAVASKTVIPMVGRFREGQPYTDLVTLDSLGLLRLGNHSISMIAKHRGRIWLSYGTKVLIFKRPPGASTDLAAAILTNAGKEIGSIVNAPVDEDLILEMAPAIMAATDSTAVFLAPVVGDEFHEEEAVLLAGSGEV
jgi:hypothetical protein